jgi:monomeric sarcosine oxidase
VSATADRDATSAVVNSVDVAIIGGGLSGAATAWAASRRGLSVALFEQFSVGHDRGSSHGSARIFRRAYGDPFYISLTGRARELWRELESDSGAQVIQTTGGLDHGSGRDVPHLAALLADQAVPHEVLTAADASERWPGMVFDAPVLFHPEAGVIDADLAVATFLARARARGAQVFERTPVEKIQLDDEGADLRTAVGTTRARRVVIAAGPWIRELAGPFLPLPPLEVTQQQVFHFARADPALAWPTFVHKDRLNIYGLPSGRDTAPLATHKLGEHDGGLPTTAATRDGVVDPAARARMVDYVRRYLPGLVPEVSAEATCLYTSTSNEDFILDRWGPAVICSPCSGHGAKFAPLIGEIATDLALDFPRSEHRFALQPGVALGL